MIETATRIIFGFFIFHRPKLSIWALYYDITVWLVGSVFIPGNSIFFQFHSIDEREKEFLVELMVQVIQDRVVNKIYSRVQINAIANSFV